MKAIHKATMTGMAGALALGISLGAAAQGANTEVSTAHAHALMAQGATTVKMAHTHLHHVVNCLVGPKGTGYDASAGDPCKGQGNGAINDVGSGSAVHGALQSALESANAGLKSNTLKTVQDDAGKAATTLQGATAAASSAATGPGASP